MLTLSFQMKPLVWVFLIFALVACPVAAAETSWKFDFGSGPAAAGYTKVPASTVYNPDRGYGFLDTTGITNVDRTTADPLTGDFCTASGPFTFSVKVPEGNYRVTVHYGDPAGAASTAIKAESRRLILETTDTKPGQLATCTFTVNMRTPAIGTGGKVAINDREKGPPLSADWDDTLSFEFNGPRPCIASLEITAAPNVPTIYIAGDSTVTDQPLEPYCAWGQFLPRFFGPGIAIANEAESGLALFSFEGEHRLEKILSTIKPGDYFFIQFGHNDQKDKTPGAGPFTTYEANLKKFVAAARAKDAIPVLVTPMERRRWKDGQFQPTLADYAAAVRQVGTEDNVPVIDLNAMSQEFYRALGPDGSTQAFVHYPANTFPGQPAELKDDTHFNSYGAYELARCIVTGIMEKVPALKPYLRSGVKPFDPSQPDAPTSIAIPRSPLRPLMKPAGH
jgi:lysophospholipase L1-like esterase